MKKIISLLLISLFSVLLVACGGDEDPITVTWSGVEAKTINVGATFNALDGVSAKEVKGESKTDLTGITCDESALNKNKAGSYVIVYSVKTSDNQTHQKNRTIKVVAASIEVTWGGVGATAVNVGTSFDLLDGVTAVEVNGGVETPFAKEDITVNDDGFDKDVIKVYNVEYSVTDSAGKPHSVTRKVAVQEPQEITVVWGGIASTNVFTGTNFDPLSGVTAKQVEGIIETDITANVTYTGAVDTQTPGDYTLTYSVVTKDGVTHSETRVITVEKTSVDKKTITIMHGAVQEIDPFLENYSGTNKLEKQTKQREVEQAYNVVVKYEPYPSDMPWGEGRVTGIINAAIAGKPVADIYWINSDWVGKLVRGQAILPVYDEENPTNSLMTKYGQNINDIFYQVGAFQGKVYGFETGAPYAETGLFYNSNIVNSLGVENPTELYLNGEWTWSKLTEWATEVKSLLPSDHYALGGAYSHWASGLVPLNGGSLVSLSAKRVAFNQKPALDTYEYISSLVTAGLFEPSPTFDAGSPDMLAGKVAMHPGRLWFVNAADRWPSSLNLKLEFVPFPVSDSFQTSGGRYTQPVSGVAMYSIATRLESGKDELAFRVWNALQLWKTEDEGMNEFKNVLKTRFNDQRSVDAFLDIYDKIELDIMNALGIGAYESQGWTINVIAGIRENDARTKMDTIAPAYEEALKEYLGL